MRRLTILRSAFVARILTTVLTYTLTPSLLMAMATTNPRTSSFKQASAKNTDFMHARYYSPNLGRFLSVDPVGGTVGSSQSWNRYSYVQNNPVNLTDPTGMCLEDLCIVEGAAAYALFKAATVGAGALAVAVTAIFVSDEMDDADTVRDPVQDLRDKSELGPGSKGRTKEWHVAWGSDPQEDFDSLPLTDVGTSQDGGAQVGTLPDGRTVSLYPESTSGRDPTLDVQERKLIL